MKRSSRRCCWPLSVLLCEFVSSSAALLSSSSSREKSVSRLSCLELPARASAGSGSTSG